MSFDAGAVEGRLELAIAGWKASVETVKNDLAVMAKESGLSTAQFSSLKGVISGLGISLKSELEAKLKAAEAALITFTKNGQLTADGQKKLEANITGLKNELAGMTGKTGEADKAQASLWKQFAVGQIAVDLSRKAFSLVKDVLEDSISEAADYEKSVKGLNSAFELSGRNMPGMVQGLRDYADELQVLGLADDGEILKAESLLLTLTHLNEAGIKAATRGAIGLVAVFGGDLQSATEAVARGFEGNYTALGKMIPAIRNATTDSERHAAMMSELEKYYQRAIADTNTYSGQVKKLGLEWKDAKKQIGEAILDSGVLQGAIRGLTTMLELATVGTKAWKAAQREGISAVNDFRISLDIVKPSMEDMRKAIEGGPEKWDAYKKGVKATDDMLKTNKDTVIAWVKDGVEFVGQLFAQEKGFNDTGKAVVGYTQEFIKARGEIQAQIAKATLSEYEAERQNLIRTAQLKIEDSKASGMRETERTEFELLQNQALAASLEDLARTHNDKMAAMRSELITQILKATSTEFNAERRAAEMEYLEQEKNLFKQIGATKDFYTWKALARKALDVKIHDIDVKEANDRFAIDTEILNATRDAQQKALDGYMANLTKEAEIEGLKKKLKLSTLDYSIWTINKELELETIKIKNSVLLNDDQKKNKIKILNDEADAKKALADGEVVMWKDMNEQIVADFIRSVGAMLTGQTTLADGFKSLMSSISNMWISGIAKMIGEGKSLEAAIGASLGTTAGAIGGLATVFSMVAAAAEAAKKTIGDFNAQALAGFKQLWERLDPIHGKILSISDDTAKELLRLGRQFGAAGAEARMLGQIMQEIGISAANFEHYMGKATNTLTLMEKGLLDTKTGTALADEQFGLLIEAAKKLGTEGSAQLVNFIKTSREMKLEIASVTKYVDEQLGTIHTGAKSAADGLLAMINAIAPGSTELTESNAKLKDELASVEEEMNKIFGSAAEIGGPGSEEYLKLAKAAAKLREEIKANEDALKKMADEGADGLKRVETQTLAVFNAMIANGASVGEASASIGPALDIIIQKHKDLGTEAGPAIAQLLKIRGVTESHKELMSAIDGNDAVLKALGNTGFLNAESLNDAAKSAGDYYDQLVAAGMGGDEALAMMGPTLSDLAEYAKTYGLTLDDDTLKMIEAAKKAGIIKEKVDMGEEAQTTNKLLGDMRDIFAAIAEKLDIVLDKIGLIPKDVTIKAKVDYDDPGLPGDGGDEGDKGDKSGKPPGFAFGGYVPRTGPAILHAGEYVISADRLAEMVGGKGGGSQPVSIERAGSIGSAVTLNFNGPLISSPGLSRADLEAKGEELWSILEFQARRHAVRLAHA